MPRLHKKMILVLFFSVTLTACVFLQTSMASGNVGKMSESSFFDSNNLYVVGEVLNTGDVAIQNVNVKILFYNSSNEKIASIEGHTDLNVILPGRKSFYNIKMLESEGALSVVNHTTWFNWTEIPAGKPLGLVILSSNDSVDVDGHKHVSGQIQNQGTVDSVNTEVSATFYNSTGTIVGTSWVFSNPSTLSPNQTGTFDLELVYTQQVLKVASYGLTAESSALALSPAPLIPEFTSGILALLLMVPLLAGAVFLRKKVKG